MQIFLKKINMKSGAKYNPNKTKLLEKSNDYD
jgi:hypothetical protein